MVRFRLLLVLLMTGVAAGQGETGRGAVPASYFGMTVQNFAGTPPLVGFGTVRTWDAYDGGWDRTPGLDWAHIETARGVYDFGAVDRYLDWAERQHAEVIYTFGRTPQWASAMPDRAGTYGLGECGAPARMEDWRAFVKALALHVHGRVRAWELWNEPNDPAAYCGDVATMVHMGQEAARIVKSVDARALVLSPGVVAEGGPAWLGKFLDGGGRQVVDVVAFHGYWSGRAEDVVALVRGYRVLAGGKPVWDTEASWAGRDGGRGGLTGGAERAAFLAKYELLQWSLGVERFAWYAYDGQEIWGRLWAADDGLREDGVAYGRVREWMLGARFGSGCRVDGEGTWRCELRRGEWEGMVVWNSAREVSLGVERKYRLMCDLGGVVTGAGKVMRVGTRPVLLETGPVR